MEKNKPMETYGIPDALRPSEEDSRDFALGDLLVLPNPVGIPDFMLEGGWANDEVQEEDDCTAFATMGASELQEGVRLDRKFQFALSKAYSGDPDEFGQDLRTAILTPIKLGSLEQEDRPAELYGQPLAFLRHINNWPRVNSLLELAAPAKKKAAVFIQDIQQGMDAFDAIKAAMWYFLERGEKRAVIFGTLWDKPIETKIIDGIPLSGSGHAMFFRGKKTIAGVEYLVAQQSRGPLAGDNGVHYFSRERVNHIVGLYRHAGMYVDYTPDEIRMLLKTNMRLDTPWITVITVNLVKRALQKIKELFVLRQPHEGPPAGPTSPWLLAALCWQESEFNSGVVGDQHLIHKAYGILQIRQPYITDAIPWRKAKECLNNVPLSVEVFRAYMKRYATAKRLGTVTDEKIARIHNGGPEGHKRASTMLYWLKVQKKIRLLESGKAPKEIYDKVQEYQLFG